MLYILCVAIHLVSILVLCYRQWKTSTEAVTELYLVRTFSNRLKAYIWLSLRSTTYISFIKSHRLDVHKRIYPSELGIGSFHSQRSNIMKIMKKYISIAYLKQSSGITKTSSSPFHSGGVVQHESGVVSGGYFWSRGEGKWKKLKRKSWSRSLPRGEGHAKVKETAASDAVHVPTFISIILRCHLSQCLNIKRLK